MEITRQQLGEITELKVQGRLDAYWADHLGASLDEAMREGADHVHLDLDGVNFVSSAGIRVVLQYHQKLAAIQGSLSISRASEQVRQVLELAGFESLLVEHAASDAPPSAAPAVDTSRYLQRPEAHYETFPVSAGATMRCRLVGDPELLLGCSFRAGHNRTVSLEQSCVALGLGAFGESFEDCKSRYGEFLAVGGAAAYFPTDGTNVADYLVAGGAFVPTMQALYGLVCEGEISQLARFEAQPGTGAVPLSELAEAALELAQSPLVAMVVVAESAGLMGAALRRSPALGGSSGAPFQHPEIREWLSFTPERAFTRSICLIAGVAARGGGGALAPMLRPMGDDESLTGHFHAAAFSYRPLQRGELDLKSTIGTLFEAETLEGVLHLLNDNRETTGAGQSEFVRGACWLSPIADVSVEGK